MTSYRPQENFRPLSKHLYQRLLPPDKQMLICKIKHSIHLKTPCLLLNPSVSSSFQESLRKADTFIFFLWKYTLRESLMSCVKSHRYDTCLANPHMISYMFVRSWGDKLLPRTVCLVITSYFIMQAKPSRHDIQHKTKKILWALSAESKGELRKSTVDQSLSLSG